MNTTETFDEVVRPLREDRSWSRRLQRVQAAELLRRAGRASLGGLAHAGFFAAAPCGTIDARTGA